MSIIQSTAKSGGTAAASFYDYPIEQSLRFDGSSYLSRTPTTAGNRRTWTWSGWVKRGNISNEHTLFSAITTDIDILRFNNTDTIGVYIYGGTNGALTTSSIYRDTSAWYHIVLASDTTQATVSNRLKLYVNGFQVTSFSSSSYPSPNYETRINNNQPHTIGQLAATNGSFYNGYLANIQFIDGQALSASSFGETKSGVWVPKEYTGSYGTNGFHLTFEDGIETLSVNGSNVSAFRDKSGNSNHWKIN